MATTAFEVLHTAYLALPDEPVRDRPCSACGGLFYDGELAAYPGGDCLCEDCRTAYLRERGAGLHTAFMLQHIPDAARVWFYKYLRPEERDSMVCAGLAAVLCGGGTSLAEFKADYCHDSDVFLEFVEATLKEK